MIYSKFLIIIQLKTDFVHFMEVKNDKTALIFQKNLQTSLS